MTEGIVHSLGVNISQPPTSGLFLTQSMLNTATSIVIFLQHIASDLATLLHGKLNSYLCQKLKF